MTEPVDDLAAEPIDPAGDEERCLALMAEMSGEYAPRRFALWYALPGWADAELVGWGFSDGTRAVLDLPRQQHSLTHTQLPGMLDRLHLRAVWVDAEPTPTPAS